MSGTLIAAPMGIEAWLVRSGLPGESGASVVRTGMGPKRARAAAEALRSRPGDALLVLGFCGGLGHEAVPGDVVIAEAVAAAADEGHGEEAVPCADVGGLEARLAASGLRVSSGPVVCVSKLALGERRAELKAGGAVAVDMESIWLAGAAAGRPFAVVRVVLDSPGHELLRPQAAAALVRAGRSLRKVAGALGSWAPAH